MFAGKQSKQEKGSFGEEIASKYLKNRGYRVLDRNMRFKFGEIDILCEKDGYLVFVEVKYSSVKNIPPEDNFTQAKKNRFLKTCNFIFRSMRENFSLYPKGWRADLVAIDASNDGSGGTLTKIDKNCVINLYENVLGGSE